MLILKNWIRDFLSIFVMLRFRTIWDIYEHISAKGLKNGLLVAIFVQLLDKRGGSIGVGAKFAGRPCFPHGFHGVFISERSIIGKNAVIFQGVTIGSVRMRGNKRNGCPVIGDNCYIGAGAKIIGNIHIGNNCRIGANAVVYEDMPDNTVAVCAPTRIITKQEPLDNRFFMLDTEGNELFWDNGVFRAETAVSEK